MWLGARARARARARASDPYNKKDIELLESVQKFACKVCLKCWDMDYQNMLHCLDIPPLSVRRRYLKLITMFNIVNGQSFFPLVFLSHSHLHTIRGTVRL